MFTFSRSLLSGRLSIPAGNGKVGRDGLLYPKADPGQAIVALPLVAAGDVTARLLPAGSLRDLWSRALASTLNAVIGAGCLVLFLQVLRTMGYGTRAALLLSLGLGFSTSLLPYTKSYLREPLLMLCLLASFYELRRHAAGTERVAPDPGAGAQSALAGPARAGLWLGVGMLVKASFLLNAPILLGYLILKSGDRERRRAAESVAFLAGPAVAAGLLGFYNLLRFGNPLESGYDPTVDNFSNPLLVGLYGQLLSSGKSIFLYAPLGLAGLWGISALARRHRAEAITAGTILAANLVLHAKFASWAGEGSWGPRYLVPFLPLLLLPAAELFASGRRLRRRAAVLALALGLLVQVGGTAIYFGSYMREIGEYPYKRSFSDPLFMVRSHFVPNYSPVVGHWRLLVRNAGLLVDSDRRPDLRPRPDVEGRLPIAEGDRQELRFVVDFWFCYLIYAGFPAPLALAPLAALLALTLWAGVRLRSSARGGKEHLIEERAVVARAPPARP
jgi:hypothetical protein